MKKIATENVEREAKGGEVVKTKELPSCPEDVNAERTSGLGIAFHRIFKKSTAFDERTTISSLTSISLGRLSQYSIPPQPEIT